METLGLCTVDHFSFKYQNIQSSFQVWRHSVLRHMALILNVSKGRIKDLYAAVAKHKYMKTEWKGWDKNPGTKQANNCWMVVEVHWKLWWFIKSVWARLICSDSEYFLPYEILGAVLPWLKNEGFCLHRNKVAPLSKLIKAPCSCGFCELLWCWESYFEHCQSNSSLIFHCTIYLSGKMPFCFSTHSLKTHHVLFCLTFPPKLSF